MGIKTASSLASQISFASFPSDGSFSGSPRYAPIDALETPIAMLPMVVPNASFALDKPQVSATGRLNTHLRHDSVASYDMSSAAVPSVKAQGLAKADSEQPLLRYIVAKGDVRSVAAFADSLAGNNALQIQAMGLAVGCGDPYMVKALLDHGVTAENAVQACAKQAPCGSMQDILNLIDTRNPPRRAWLKTLYQSAQVCRMRPFADLMTFLKPRPFELRESTSILHVAAQAGSSDAADKLLGHGMSPFLLDGGKTPFDLAVAADHDMVIKVFVDSAAMCKKLGSKVLSNYLSAAVDNGALKVAKVLMQAGAQANAAQVVVARKRFEDDMVCALEANLAAQPVRTTILQKVKSIRLRREPNLLVWDESIEGPELLT